MKKFNCISILSLLLFCACFVCLFCKASLASDPIIIDKSQVAAAITSHIEKHMPWQKGKVRVTFPSGITEIVSPSKNYKIEVRENRNDEYIGDRLYNVKVWHKNQYVKQIFVPTTIEVCKDIVLSTKYLKKDTNISAQDLSVTEKWFSRVPRDIITDPENILGKRLLRSINAQTPFTSSMLSSPIMFKKGKVVKIVCDNDSLNISTLGLAEEEGIYGAMVKVKNISSNKIIQGRVIGDAVVKVEI